MEARPDATPGNFQTTQSGYANQKCRLPERADLSNWLHPIDRAMGEDDDGTAVQAVDCPPSLISVASSCAVGRKVVVGSLEECNLTTPAAFDKLFGLATLKQIIRLAKPKILVQPFVITGAKSIKQP